MIKSIAAYLYKINQPLKIEEIYVPDPEIGQVLVKIICSSICGRQISEITGAKGKDNFLPHLLGHEGFGQVVKVGPGVTKVKNSDKIVMHWRTGSGIESNFPSYKNAQGKKIGGGLITTFTQYSLISENRLTKIPNNTPSDLGALMGCATSTAFSMVNKEAKLKIGESVVVFGSGGVGLNIILASKLVAAYPIVVIDNNDKKLQLAKKIGATHILNSKKKNFHNLININFLNNRGCDVAIDTTGVPSLIELGYKLIKNKKGRLIMVGQPFYKKNLIIKNVSNNFTGKKILDSQGGLFDPDNDLNNFINYILKNKINYEKIITDRVKLKNINTAINKIKRGKILGKVIIDMFEQNS